MRTKKIVGRLYDRPSKTCRDERFVVSNVNIVEAELESLKNPQTRSG